MDFIFILWALAVGVGIGLFASREWVSKPLWETEAKLRKELGEVRRELFGKEQALTQAGVGRFLPKLFGPESVRDLAAHLDLLVGTETGRVSSKHSIAHFDLTEPKIEHRSPSDVFFLDVEDLLL